MRDYDDSNNDSFQTGHRSNGPNVCYGCGEPGHFARECPQGQGERFQSRRSGVCFKFQEGNCPYADTCKFSHVLGGEGDRPPAGEGAPGFGSGFGWRQQGGGNRDGGFQPRERRAPGVCYKWQEGNCHFGDTCKFRHYEQ